MKFFISIGRNALYTYEHNDQCFKPQFIEGSDSYHISSTNITEDVNSFMNILANEKNIDTVEKLEFEVLEGTDIILNKAIVSAFGEQIVKVYSLDKALKTVIKKILHDKKFLIDTYVINYDGCSYKVENNNLLQGEFDLLGYTIHCKDVVDLMDL